MENNQLSPQDNQVIDLTSQQFYREIIKWLNIIFWTGVTACALVYSRLAKTDSNRVKVETKGGNLMVTWEMNGHGFHHVFLIGPATLVDHGKIERC